MEKQLSPEDTGSFIQALAHALAGKSEGRLTDYGIVLQDFKKIKMDLKPEGEMFGIKLKVKYSTPSPESTTEDAGALMKYKTLKKQMKSTFKALKTAIEGGSMPDKEKVETFMQQAELMVSYKDRGYGDEYYEEFIKLCHEFKKIIDAGDFEPLAAAFNAIDARKALCHDKYD